MNKIKQVFPEKLDKDEWENKFKDIAKQYDRTEQLPTCDVELSPNVLKQLASQKKEKNTGSK